MIGMPGLLEFDSIEENITLCKTLELDFIELNMNLPMYNHLIDVDKINRMLKENNLKVSLHLSETFDPFELDPIIRAARLESFRRALDIASALDAFLLNMHLSKGIHFTLPDKKVNLYEQFQEEYLKHVHSFKSILDKVDIDVCIENTGIHNLSYIQEATDILLESDRVFLTYDIGHDITSGYKDRDYYTAHQKDIKHYHIHDGTETQNHMALFTGKLDINHYLNQAKETHASCVIEVKSKKQLTTSINKLRTNI
jgi:sugar phosphate isomerase/epimerase